MILPISTWSRLKYFSKISRIGAAEGSHIFELQMAQAIGVDIWAPWSPRRRCSSTNSPPTARSPARKRA